MTAEERDAINEEAIRRMKPVVDATYPHKQLVAFADGKIVADAETLEGLEAKLAALGFGRDGVMLDIAGEDTLSELIFI